MKKNLLIFVMFLAVALSGCGLTSSNEMKQTEEFESALETAVLETIAASVPKAMETSSQAAPTQPLTTPGVQPTLQSTATFEPLPTQTMEQVKPTGTPLPTPCYRAELVEETIPDGTKFPPGEWFGKVWIVKNTGVCEWTEDFRWVLVEGEDFDGETDVPLNQSVLPGEDLRVLLELKAPLIPGTYKGTYQIWTKEGASVTPLGFWVLIVVE